MNPARPSLPPRRWSRSFHLLVALLTFLRAVPMLQGQDVSNPLKPPDRSSPRAALKTFLDAGDTLGAFLARDYLPSPTRAEFQRLVSLGDAAVRSLDLSEVPPAAREKTGRAAAVALYGTLSRIHLPSFDEIPDAAATAGTNLERWIIPNTEIALERVAKGPRSGEFLFSPATVVNAPDYFERVRGLPYTRPMPLENLKEILSTGGGWLIPYRWVQSLPAWLRTPVVSQAVWKWIGLAILMGLFSLLLHRAYRLSRRGTPEHPLQRALAQMVLPAYLIVAAPAVAYFALAQLNFIGAVASAIQLVVTAVMFLAGAWIAWRFAPVVAETIIASPSIAPESIDAHLIRICTRLLGIVAGASLLAVGADRLGLPVYGIIAGLSVGGLAIALAAQPTVENLIGGFTLFADKPLRVGDACRCGGDEGTVEAIGIRSTRIRGADRTVTTIPNSTLSKMSIMNLAQRDRMLIKSVVGVRYETSPEQLRYLLIRIRELLLGHPHIDPASVRARFVGFGASSLDIEVVAYAMTKDRGEFLGIQEELLLRIMDLVAQSGTDFAFPSQTLYLSRDGGLDADRTRAAEAQVRQWLDQGHLASVERAPEQR